MYEGEITSHKTALEKVTLHHLEWVGADPPVIFLPGFISNGNAARRIGAAIAPLRKVMALDLRGRGDSDKPQGKYGMEQHMQDLYAWLGTRNIRSCILAGHSFGASLAIFFTHQHPEMVEKLILLDGGAVSSPQAFQMFRHYHENLTYEYDSVEAYVEPYRKLITLQPWTDEAELLVRSNVIEQFDGSAIRKVPRYVVVAELSALSLDRWQIIADIYPTLALPVLLVRAGMGSFGRDDQHLTDAVVQGMSIPDLQVFDMPDAGHTGILTVHDTRRDKVLREFVLPGN